MHTRHKHTSLYRNVFFFLIFLTATALWYFGHHRPAQQAQHTQTRPPEHISPPVTEIPRFIIDIENTPPLSSEATVLLAQLKKEARTYASQLTNGEIDFSVTLSRKRPSEHPHFFLALWNRVRDTLMPPKEIEIEKPPKYDVLGEWNITYRFEGDTEFFDVKARKKREMNQTLIVTRMPDGRLRSDIWRETHHRFMRKQQQELYIQDGAMWKPFEKWRLSLSASQQIHFDPRFNPRWWHFGHDASFDTFIRRHKITDVKTVDIGGSSQIYLQLYDTEQIKTTYRAKKKELYLHPQEGVHPKHILTSTRAAGHFLVYEEGWFSRPKPIPGQYKYGESVNFHYLTSELAQYEPGIWFPKTVIEEDFPSNASRVIMDEARLPESLPESLREEYQTAPLWKRVMKVHRAVFNPPKHQLK